MSNLLLEEKIQQADRRLQTHSQLLPQDCSAYWDYHRERFLMVGRLLYGWRLKEEKEGQSLSRFLDVGPGYQTMLFEDLLENATFDTFGYSDSRFPLRKEPHHYHYNLNQSIDPDKWPAPPSELYDVMTMLEVIEHLYTSPLQVFACLKRFLRPGGLFFVQTPNAVSLSKRVRMLLGSNPYELIREDRVNAGHFREYTRDELIHYGISSGFKVEDIIMSNYWSFITKIERTCTFISKYLPQEFRDGLLIIFCKID
ncbi:MAG: class I SAM-dependent methyltransferase [Prochloraceae cyanobacterium]|nr:class I SAM-dependent methyltransferase [Prochloraceae cyanobacterium]